MKVGIIFSDICESTYGQYSFKKIKNFLMESINVFKQTFEDMEYVTEQLIDNTYMDYINKELSNSEFMEYIAENFANLSSAKFLFKLVGDGIIFILESYPSNFETKAYEYHKKLKEKVQIPFRTVATIGNLECFDFKIQNCPLRECIGQDLSILIKYSKNVDDFKYIKR